MVRGVGPDRRTGPFGDDRADLTTMRLRCPQVDDGDVTTTGGSTAMAPHGNDQKNQQRDNGGFAMMASCTSVVVLLLLISVVGWPIGLTIGVVGFVGMMFVHQRMMGGRHR